MKKEGDFSYIKKGLFKKVYKNGVALEVKGGGKAVNYIYKMINAWGDSFRAQEFYGKEFPLNSKSTVSRSSILDNGFLKVVREVEDSEIELALLGTTQIVSATIEETNKPDSVSQEEWDALSDEEKNKINEC
jgi:hypothetical protein